MQKEPGKLVNPIVAKYLLSVIGQPPESYTE